MSLKVNNDLSFNFVRNNFSEKTEIFDIGSFQLEKDLSIGSKEISKLPSSMQDEIKGIFLSIVNRADVQKVINEKKSSSISLNIKDGKLFYRLQGTSEYKEVLDKKVQKCFERVALETKKYLKNIQALNESGRKIVKISDCDKEILKSAPNDVEKVSKAMFKKMKKSDAEWSSWVIWACSLREFLEKICKFLGIKFDFKIIPDGVDSLLGYLFGVFGVFNGLEQDRDSKKIGDVEGQREGKNKVFRNALSLFGSIFDCISKALMQTVYAASKIVFGAVASIIFVVVSIYSTIRYAYSYLIALNFRSKFSKYLDNYKLTDHEKMIGALKFLKNRVTVTEDESLDIINKIRKQNPTLEPNKVKERAHIEISKKLLTKVKRFERRVGDGIVSTIHQHVDNILKDPKNADNIKRANLIFTKVKDKNLLNIQENKWYAIAALLTVSELVLLYAFGYSTLASLCGGLSSGIGAIIMGAYFYKKYLKKEKELKQTMIDQKLDLLADPAI